MSVEEDTELRDLITQTLEANGCFAKIRAQMRASIYMALDEDEMFQKSGVIQNPKLQSMLATADGKIMFCIVREFLEYFNLEFTISVFESESCMGSNYEHSDRYKIIEDLNISYLEQESSDPVLLQLIRMCKLNNKYSDSQNTENSLSNMSSKNVTANMNDNDSSIMASNYIHSLNKSAPTHFENVLNETFDVNIQDFEQYPVNTDYKSYTDHKNIINKKDVGSVSILTEDECQETPLIDFDKSVRLESSNNTSEIEKTKSLIDQTIVDQEFSPPVVRDGKHSKFDTSFDKLKLASPKAEKMKSKNNLTSLSDLPALQISKPRTNDMLLPSLYTKDFKDKSNIKDVDKLFELEPLDNYEEDFISETEIDMPLGKQDDTTHMLQEDSQKEILHKNQITTHSNVNIHTPTKDDDLDKKTNYLVEDNSITSNTTCDDFELNSNVDDILHSC